MFSAWDDCVDPACILGREKPVCEGCATTLRDFGKVYPVWDGCLELVCELGREKPVFEGCETPLWEYG